MSLLGCPPIASNDIHTFAIKGLSSAGGPQDWALAIWVRCLAIRPNAQDQKRTRISTLVSTHVSVFCILMLDLARNHRKYIHNHSP
jgi:hypothetical protein